MTTVSLDDVRTILAESAGDPTLSLDPKFANYYVGDAIDTVCDRYGVTLEEATTLVYAAQAANQSIDLRGADLRRAPRTPQPDNPTGASGALPAYTTDGPVRGDCGHRHRTIEGAVRCLWNDRAGCARQGGYSDRGIVRADGEPLDEWEHDEIQTVLDRLDGWDRQ